MKMFKKVLAGFVAAAMVATMVGCGSSSSSEPAAEDTEAAPQSRPPPGGGDAIDHGKTQ